MRYLKNSQVDPYYNMAFDEYCLEHLPIDEPVFYLWQNRPAVIVGFNQDVYAEVNLDYLHQNDIALVRRVTGGGAVYHDLGNLNYTIVGRSEDLERDYPEYAGLMMKALQQLGVPATLSGRNDILVDGKKVSGFAKRVSNNRLMVHGTLMYQVDLDVLTKVLNPSATKLQSKGVASVRSRVANLCDYLPNISSVQDFSHQLEQILSSGYADQEYVLAAEALEQIQQTARDKFAQREWNYGRSPKATLTRSARLACGTVEIHLSVVENQVEACHFGGDFLGNLPMGEIEQALIGVPYNVETVREALSVFEITDYLDGVEVDSLLSLLF